MPQQKEREDYNYDRIAAHHRIHRCNRPYDRDDLKIQDSSLHIDHVRLAHTRLDRRYPYRR